MDRYIAILLVCCLVVLIALPISPSYLFTETKVVSIPTEIDLERPKKSLVRIVTESSENTGFYINNHDVLTAYHGIFTFARCANHGPFVVKNTPKIDGETPAILTKEDDGEAYLFDMALLRTEKEGVGLEIPREGEVSISPGKPVILLGMVDIESHITIRFSLEGHIIGLWKEFRDIEINGMPYRAESQFFMLDIIAFAGLSGSPVLDTETGRVIGMVQAVTPNQGPFMKMGYTLGTVIDNKVAQSLRN